MWNPQYDIIVETLTGSEFEVTVTDKDTVGYIKSRIQKYEGIPVGQQHLLYNHKELSDATEMKDIPLGNGSRLKLVLDMKGGPVSARRVVSIPDHENWFDISDVLNTTRHDPLTISTPGVKLLVYKDCKKNIHRIMKFRSDRKNYGTNKTVGENTSFASDSPDDQWVKDNLQTLEKMHQLRSKLEMKKKNKIFKNGKRPQMLSNECEIASDIKGNERNDRLDAISSSFKTHTGSSINNPLEIDTSAKSNRKSELGGGVHTQQHKCSNAEKLSGCDFMLQGRRSSCGLLNKYGLNKTFIRPPSLVSSQNKKNESYYQLHNLSPLSQPPPAYATNTKLSGDIELPMASAASISSLSSTAQQTLKNSQHSQSLINVFKNNCNNLAINRPKCKPILNTINNVNSLTNCSEETRSKLRENIRRNRSFKTINTNDLITDDINLKPISSVLDHIFNTSSRKHNIDKHPTSKSVQDLIEKLSSTKLAPKAPKDSVIDFSKNIVGIEKERELRLPKRTNPPSLNGSNGFENKLFIERQQTIGLSSMDGGGSVAGASGNGGCSASDFKLENSGSTTNSALDGSFRLYKMSSEAKNNYELPKLLIREDSPVESFHSSDPQLETLALRGESPKTVMDPYQKIATSCSTVNTSNCDAGAEATAKSLMKSPWNHRHSDLGLNNLELNFLNEDYSDIEFDGGNDGRVVPSLGVGVGLGDLNGTNNTAIGPNAGIGMSGGNSACLQNGSVLKIASNLEINNSWNTSSEVLDGKSQPSTTSLNFINGDLTSSDDEEDVFNTSCCMLHSNSKSKSIELNEFRMMFGSSPTLLNTNYNPVTHASRLDAVPIQYRRGYTNLTDACLSSSTSDLELFNGVRKRNSSKSASQELPSSYSLHHHRTSQHHGPLDFVRSYENLDRMKILRMKNDRSRNLNSNSSSSGIVGDIDDTSKHYWDSTNSVIGSTNIGNKTVRCPNGMPSTFSRERLQEEDLCAGDEDDDDYSYSNLAYDNAMPNGSDTSMNDCLPIGFPSDESLFNMNLDSFTDDFNLLSSASLSSSDRLLNSSNNNKETSRSSLVLSELHIDGLSTVKKVKNRNSISHNDGSSNFNESMAGISKLPSADDEDFQSTLATAAIGGGRITGDGSSEFGLPVSVETSSPLTSVTGSTILTQMKVAKKPEKLRCAQCNKKLGLIMIMKCHCEKVFCPQHRYAESHNCSYNFKSEGKKILSRENPLVVAQKLPKI